MTEKTNYVSQNVYSIIHELLVPLKGLVGAHSILNDKVPQIIEEPLDHFGQISNKLHEEIMTLFREPAKEINLQSADIAAEQMRLLSSGWMMDVEKLSQAISQMNAGNIRLEDDLLDKILDGVLSEKGLEHFGKMVSCLTQVQAKHLTLDDGFSYVLHFEK